MRSRPLVTALFVFALAGCGGADDEAIGGVDGDVDGSAAETSSDDSAVTPPDSSMDTGVAVDSDVPDATTDTSVADTTTADTSLAETASADSSGDSVPETSADTLTADSSIDAAAEAATDAEPDATAEAGPDAPACETGTRMCGATCLPLDSITGCGTSCAVCSAPAHAAPTCSGSPLGCDFACDGGYHRCGDHCAADTSVSECGAACTACTPPAHASAVCAGSCDFTCTAPYVRAGATCAAPPPRPIGPLSTEIVGARKPTLRWQLPTGFTTAHVEVCADRACATVLWSSDVTGTSVAVGTTLSRGIVYWRLSTVDGSTPSAVKSPVWELAIAGTHSAPTTAVWGSFPDFEGDGFGDLVMTANGSASRIRVYPGSSGGTPASPAFSQDCPGSAYCPPGANVGDVNGDGFGDLGWIRANAIEIYYGGPSGLPSTASFTIPADTVITRSAITKAGDLDGDGYADVAVRTRTPTDGASVSIYFGSASGLSATPRVLPKPSGATDTFGQGAAGVGQPAIAEAGDIDGDGYGDLLIADWQAMSQFGRAWIYRGSATGPSTTPSTTIVAPTATASVFGWSVSGAGDVNGDGYADVVIGAAGGGALTDLGAYVYYGSSTGLVTATHTQSTCDGNYVAGAIDLDGDGYADVLCDFRTGGPTYPYGVDVFRGSSSGAPTSASQQLLGPNPAKVAAGDVRALGVFGDSNGDGYGDFALEARWNDGVAGNVFEAEVFRGGAPSLSTTPAKTYSVEAICF